MLTKVLQLGTDKAGLSLNSITLDVKGTSLSSLLFTLEVNELHFVLFYFYTADSCLTKATKAMQLHPTSSYRQIHTQK